MLDAEKLTYILKDSLAATTDAKGVPIIPPNMTIAYAQGVIAALKGAIVSNPPGTIVGATSPGGPLGAGAGAAGIVVVSPGPMLAKTMVGLDPVTAANLAKENTALCAYLSTALIVFAPGTITGQCGNSAESPGPLSNGAGTGGLFTVINGPACAAAIGAVGALPFAPLHYTKLCAYIIASAEASYPSGGVTGVCPPGGGALIAGAGVGGTVK